MEPHFPQFSAPLGGFNSQDALFPFPHRNLSISLNCSGSPSPFSTPSPSNSPASSGVSLSCDNESDDTVFNYISQMLMEEDMEERPCMFHDPLALQATEKSFYDALCANQPPLMDHSQSPPYTYSSDDNHSGITSDYGNNCNSSVTSGSASVDSRWIGDTSDYRPSILRSPIPNYFVFQSTANSSLRSSSDSERRLTKCSGKVGSPASNLLVPNIFSDEESMSYFQKGMEEASKFLPKGIPLLTDFEKGTSSSSSKVKNSAPVVNSGRGVKHLGSSPHRLTVKKHERDDISVEEERRRKQSAICPEDETELSDMFDQVLLCAPTKDNPNMGKTLQNKFNLTEIMQKNVHSVGFTDGRGVTNMLSDNKESVDLRALLLACAQAVSDDDHKTANHYLQKIRNHSSPFGDGSQRLAHCFANALEARMAGTGAQMYTALDSKRTSASETLMAYQTYMSVFPFQRFGIIFSNHMIITRLAEKASILHIIDFGILYGFQWPAVIHWLSKREGGPPKLRITGIELPQRGFRPRERVEETGRRLARYCKRFNVPFEYNPIAQKWETIQIADLKIRPGEVVAVNCLFRFRHLFDETVLMNSPRNQVLNLVRKIKPSLFLHSVVNGNFNALFFVTRFREALFHYSTMFDAFDAKLSRESHLRLTYENNFYGRESMNIIACEGTERVERPETYKQWQIRNTRVGFKQLPLDPVILKKLKSKLSGEYHEDFVIDVDGNWMLQGWKGRILFASSCWVPE
ncbi:hypothetical protein SAY87_015882 [Trapa incisa]|uniref:Scarecrow-like protein 14 n=1 Tax=Trapa incisa TaxID=236973 RepID=A0AAN7QWZ7_9MYRT|nr:hypothetical protein SAY87_015882 [Trapa incisa]